MISPFFQAIEWIIKNGNPVIPVFLVSLVQGILSQLSPCHTKMQFIHGLLKGGGANMNTTSRLAFAKMVTLNFQFSLYRYFGILNLLFNAIISLQILVAKKYLWKWPIHLCATTMKN